MKGIRQWVLGISLLTFGVAFSPWSFGQRMTGNSDDIHQINEMLSNAGSPGRQFDTARPEASGESVSRDKSGESAVNASGTPQLQRRYPRYRVEYGDSFNLQFAFVPEFNQSVTIQPDGYVSLYEVGDVHVEGLTAAEIATKVRKAYSDVLHDPVVTVSLTNFDRPYFIVGGQVGHPGKYDLRGDTTVTQAVEIAGGLTENSKHSQVLLFRKVSDNWMEAKTLNLKKMLHAGNLSEDLHLQPGDMLYVPQNRLSKLAKFLPIPHPGLIVNPSTF